MARLPPATTRLSHPKASGPQRSGRNRRLARPSLLVGVVAVISSACIVSDPAEYGVAKQTPPFLNATKALPSVLKTHPVKLGETIHFNVPLRSEDAGEELLAQVFVDRGVPQKENPRGFREIAPGRLDDGERPIDIPVDVVVADPGCHSLTMVVTHKSNLDEKNQPKKDDDTAVLTWWVNVDDDEGKTLMGECPSSGGTN